MVSRIEEAEIGIFFIPFVTLFFYFYKHRMPEYTIKLWTDKYLLDTIPTLPMFIFDLNPTAPLSIIL